MSGTAKANLVAVFDKVGGVARMARWAAENETEFYKLYARLVPVEAEVSGKDGQALGVVILPAVKP